MAYKSILVHLNNERRVPRLIDAAMRLALPTGAHLTGLYVVPPRPPYSSPIFPSVSGSMAQSGINAHRKIGESTHEVFKQATSGLPIVAEWQLCEAKRTSYVEAVLDFARVADLVIAAQTESDWDDPDMFDVPEWLALDSGRPVLIVPKAGDMTIIGQRVLVAWNNSREAARAVFDALPLLQSAQEVRVLCVEEADKPQTTRDLPAASICATLSRHGVNCVADHIKPTKDGVAGEDVLAQVRQHNCDLLVMGCYGRSRLREFVFGGASRHVLQKATVPVLMAH